MRLCPLQSPNRCDILKPNSIRRLKADGSDSLKGMAKMNKNRYAVFLDIDGTLLWGSRIPAKKDRDAIQAARQNGHLIFLNTGRGPGNIPKELRCAMPVDGIIAGGGAWILIDGSVIYKKEIALKEAASLCEMMLSHKISTVFEGEQQNAAILPNKSVGDVAFDEICSKDDILPVLEKDSWSKITFLARRDALPKEVLSKLTERFDVIAHPNYCEAILLGCDKAKGMAQALSYTNIPRERSIAMGDSLNDSQMLSYAQISVAMGNALDPVKEMADYVTLPVTECGVAAALVHFGLISEDQLKGE